MTVHCLFCFVQAMKILDLAVGCDAAAESFRLKAVSFRREAVELLRETMEKTKARSFSTFLGAFCSSLIPDRPQVCGVVVSGRICQKCLFYLRGISALSRIVVVPWG